MTAEVKHLERLKLVLPRQQQRDGGGQIRQVGPGVAGMVLARVGDGLDGAAGLDEALAEPAVARARPEEVTGTNDQHWHALARSLAQALFHRHADLTLSSDGILWR